MSVETFFARVLELKAEMEKQSKLYSDSLINYHNLTGTNYSSMPKGKSMPAGLEKLLIMVETAEENYLKAKKDYEEEYERCMEQIRKLPKQEHKLIIEYSQINCYTDKCILEILRNYHNLNYTYSYFRKLKSNALKLFGNIIR